MPEASENAPRGRRHVPSRRMEEMEDVGFDAALSEAQRPNPEYDVSRWLFVPNRYTEYRYILGTRGQRPLICVGINPSTARPDALDPTLQSVSRIAQANGFDSFLMFNVSAQRATDPNDMERALFLPIHRENMRAFDYALSLSDAPTVWAAWGTIIEKRPYLPGCLRDMAAIAARRSARWVCCGACSKKGHPHHPLYLRASSPLTDFDMDAYLNVLPAGTGAAYAENE